MADLGLARKVLETEAAAIHALVVRIDATFAQAVQMLGDCRGRVILTGMGKSGIISQKIAATLTSIGTPAHFLHPAEAIHGDIGVIRADDVVVAVSYSGETDEVVRLLMAIRRLGAKLIALTASASSTLGKAADITLDCSVAKEACPLNLVPTASTTVALAMGDALAMTLAKEKGFKVEDFHSLHPGGKLGRLLKHAEWLMHGEDKCPRVAPGTRMRDVIYEMSSKKLGMTCVVDEGNVLLGIITDGDLRRQMERQPDILALTAADVMTRGPVTVSRRTDGGDVLDQMEQRKITSVVVVEDGGQQVAGVVHLHDLLGTQTILVSIEATAAKIRLVLFDVDGVLTDGKVVIHADATESKTFDIKDGIAMVWAQRAGLTVGLLSARQSATTPHRAAQLGITLVRQGVPNKLDAYDQILSELGLTDPQVSYMGDDVVDLAVLGRVGLSTAPADAVAEVRARVDWVSTRIGGDGAARELLEMILRAQGRWEPLVAAYADEGRSIQS